MKKRFSKLLAILCAVCLTVSITVPAFAAEITSDPQEYTATTVSRGPIVFPVTFDSGDIALYDQFAAMSSNELLAYINDLSPSSQSTYGTNSDIVDAATLAMQGFVALAAFLAKEDLPCAAELVLHSLAGEDYSETDGIFTETIKQSPTFLNWVPSATVGSSLEAYYGPDEIEDLFLSLRHVTITCPYISSQGKVIYLSDPFNFELQMCETLKATFFNTAAWLFTQTGVMTVIEVDISFIY